MTLPPGQGAPWEAASLARGIAQVRAHLAAQPPAPVAVRGTRVVWTGLRGWLRAVADYQGTYRCATPWFEKAHRLYRSLTPAHVEACRDLTALEQLDRLLRASRYGDGPLRHGLRRTLTRAELGALIVLAGNQLRWVRAGCPDRTKGPRFDPRRLPDSALDRLIQSHPDLAVVEILRAERLRRSTLPT